MPTCKRCGKSFESRAFGGHASYCGKENVTECNICGEKVPKRSIKRHIKAHKRDHDCPECGKRINGLEDKVFCDHSCCAKFQNKSALKRKVVVKDNCKNCGKRMERKGRFCDSSCQHEYNHQEYIKKWIVGDVSGNQKGDESISSHIRRWLFERAGGKCEGKNDDGSRCSWARTNQFTKKTPLTAHHKDGNARNTTPENMELICPGCHSLTETYGGRNKGKGRKFRRVPVSQR